MIQAPYYPIVYLRGYAMTSGEVEETVSTPYMGFNRGSTRIRQLYSGEVRPHVFESPLVRLMKDHSYVDAYRDGQLRSEGPISARSVWIFRYYDIADKDLGEGERKEIEFHALKLREFLLHVRSAVLEEGEDPEHFRVYLVAHSMGGLICRCYLQNPDIPDLSGNRPVRSGWRSKGVDKLFSYGTPHGGINFRRGLGWVEGVRDFLDPNNAGNFGPRRMREFLHLGQGQDLNSLDGWFPEERVFCLVGTDARDYPAAKGLSRRAVGPLSDGLVQIKNASVANAARAFVHRSHSGPYGLVNSESGYQNLRRFLFGDWRVLLEMTDVGVTLPPKLARAAAKGATVRASYYIDAVFSVRGVPIQLSRRTYREGSAVRRTNSDLHRPIKLLTAFVMDGGRVNRRRRSLGFALRIGIRVPEYEGDDSFHADHYEGGVLFADKVNIEVTRDREGRGSVVRYGWDRNTPNRTARALSLRESPEGNSQVGEIPFGNGRDVRPGIQGRLRLTVTAWNK